MWAKELNRRIETVAPVWQYGPAECATLAARPAVEGSTPVAAG